MLTVQRPDSGRGRLQETLVGVRRIDQEGEREVRVGVAAAIHLHLCQEGRHLLLVRQERRDRDEGPQIIGYAVREIEPRQVGRANQAGGYPVRHGDGHGARGDESEEHEQGAGRRGRHGSRFEERVTDGQQRGEGQ